MDKRVIIPRSFIAELLADELYPWIADPEGVETVLDVCTGSGCLAILAARAFPNALVDGVDISKEALEVAHINNRSYRLQKRVRFNVWQILQVLLPSLRANRLIICPSDMQILQVLQT